MQESKGMEETDKVDEACLVETKLGSERRSIKLSAH